MKTNTKLRLAYVGNYPPRKCGIGTFTENLVKAIAAAGKSSGYRLRSEIIAMNNGTEHSYPAEVKQTIQDSALNHYFRSADYINRSADICILQHEYGIFGGEHGQYILKLADHLKIPLFVTLHTVLKEPGFIQRNVVRHLAKKAHYLIVMSRKARQFLIQSYGIPTEKIRIIEHGVPDLPLENRDLLRQKLGFSGKKVMLTFGLLGPGKGLETMIRALPGIVSEHPDVEYWVLGKTHPTIVKHEGEKYRKSLCDLARQLKVEQFLKMKDEFVDETCLFNYLVATDLFVTPYPNEAQITSGTLSYAIGAGTPVVSTPYWHAQELLADGRGAFFDFGNSAQLTDMVNQLFHQEDQLRAMAEQAAVYGDTLRWKNKGSEYVELILEAVTGKSSPTAAAVRENYRFPALNFRHLIQMTDRTGVIQHAKYSVPNFHEGYCLDDNARALLVGVMAYRKGYQEVGDVLRSALGYICYMQRPDGLFRNFLSYDRQFLDEVSSDDAFGRTLWALSYALAHPTDPHYQPLLRELYLKALPHLEKITSIRAIAYNIMGLCTYLEGHRGDSVEMQQLLQKLARRLVEEYRAAASEDWHWFEPILAYGNAFLPLALIRSLEYCEDAEVREIAFESLAFLESLTLKEEHLRPIGCQPFYRRGESCQYFDQQPIEAMAMVLLYRYAYRLSGSDDHYRKAWICFQWFTGRNDLHLPLYDAQNGGCYDGLTKEGLNLNQGAESTLAFLIAYLEMMDLKQEAKLTMKQRAKTEYPAVVIKAGVRHKKQVQRRRLTYMKD